MHNYLWLCTIVSSKKKKKKNYKTLSPLIKKIFYLFFLFLSLRLLFFLPFSFSFFFTLPHRLDPSRPVLHLFLVMGLSPICAPSRKVLHAADPSHLSHHVWVQNSMLQSWVYVHDKHSSLALSLCQSTRKETVLSFKLAISHCPFSSFIYIYIYICVYKDYIFML